MPCNCGKITDRHKSNSDENSGAIGEVIQLNKETADLKK